MIQQTTDIMIETVAFHRATRVPHDTVQWQTIANDPATHVDQLFPGHLEFGGAHQMINATRKISKKKEVI